MRAEDQQRQGDHRRLPQTGAHHRSGAGVPAGFEEHLPAMGQVAVRGMGCNPSSQVLYSNRSGSGQGLREARRGDRPEGGLKTRESPPLQDGEYVNAFSPGTMSLSPDGPLLVSGDVTAAANWCDQARQGLDHGAFLLVLAATATAAVAGISAAGSTPESRRFTAAADGELVVLGPTAPRPHALPPLPAGVSPALISWVVLEQLRLARLVVNAGVEVAPAVAHEQVPGCQPAACLSTGRALPLQRVQDLLRWGEDFGQRWVRRQQGALLVVGECVAGGTSTAAAILRGLGVDEAGLVSGSLRQPPHQLRHQLVAQGLQRAGHPSTALELVAAVGDPMQPLVAGVILGCAGAAPLLLAGGSQMAAVLALALALARARGQPVPPLLRSTAVGTTCWVAREPGSNLALLLERVHGQLRLPQAALAMASSLNFSSCIHPALRDYEAGYVKEGVGAGGLAVVASLAGLSNPRLACLCDQAMDQLRGIDEP